MKISKEKLKQIIKEELGKNTEQIEAISNQVRGNTQVNYLNNKQEVETALKWYFASTSAPAATNALNFVLGWIGRSGKK